MIMDDHNAMDYLDWEDQELSDYEVRHYLEKSELREWLVGVLHAIYRTGDIVEMENCLEELCEPFGLKLPGELPKLVKHEEEEPFVYVNKKVKELNWEEI